MAASILPGPGSIWGPCDEPCSHSDCGLTHEQARTECELCNEPIGFENRFYDDREHGLVHAGCLLDRYESRPDAYGTAVAEREAAGL